MVSTKTKAKRLAVCVLATSVLLQATPSFAAPKEDVKVDTSAKLKESKANLAKIRASIEKTEAKLEKLHLKIEDMDNKVIESMDKLDKINSDIEKSEKKVEKLRSELKEAEDRYAVYLDAVRTRLQSMQETRMDKTELVLNTLLTADGFTTLISRAQALKTIINTDNASLETLKTMEEDLRTKKEDLDKEVQSQRGKKEKQERILADIKKDKKLIDKEAHSAEKLKKKLLKAQNKERGTITDEQERLAEEALEKLRIELERQKDAEKAEELKEREIKKIREALLQESTRNNTNAPNYAVGATEEEINEYLESIAISDVDYSRATKVITEATKYLGIPYVWGGTTPRGFDCSGLMQYVYREVGVDLPRVSRDQAKRGVTVGLDELQAGDLLFRGSPVNHVAMYIGNGKYLHAPQTGDVVKISTFHASYWGFAKRVL